MEDRGSYFLPVTSHYYAGRIEGREGNGVVVVTRFRPA